ncbi:hypothetical protein L3Q82_013822, partial [Scortum barcoo]
IDNVRETLNNHWINLKKRFEYVKEGIAEDETGSHLDTIYTELYITEGESKGINPQHEVWQLENVFTLKTFHETVIICSDIFKPSNGQDKCLKVLTKGIAGSGKTVCTQKSSLTGQKGVKQHCEDRLLSLFCKLSEESCKMLANELSSTSISLRELDLGNNELKETGVEWLSALLQSSNCYLETLRVSGCLIREEGSIVLASALRSNPSHLDLSYNHPGDSGVKLLSAGLDDPHWRLDTLRLVVLVGV